LRFVLCSLALSAGALAATSASRAQSLAGEAERALAGDESAIARLREAGPAGLSAFLDAAASGQDTVLGPAVSAALDRICAQRHCAASRLFWYTDLAAAQKEAARRGVPIVSLRLLGRLDEEQSCANSRYFRIALYSDPAVAQWLRENAVLHWSSERPVPRVSIDFGDGRRLEGTVTGNSAHYLLDSRGRPLDVLPGLYSPSAFRRWLESAAPLARAAAGYDDRELASRLRAFHREALDQLEQNLVRDLDTLQVAQPKRVAAAALAQSLPRPAAPTAVEASAATASKSWVEVPFLEAAFDARPERAELLDVGALARLEHWHARCGAACRALAAANAPWAAADLDQAIRRFEAAMAVDTLRNEVRLHAQVHRWFAYNGEPYAWVELNRRVYEELFLSSPDDPWLGLGPREVFSVLTPVEKPGG
jgi:hypothetical protein